MTHAVTLNTQQTFADYHEEFDAFEKHFKSTFGVELKRLSDSVSGYLESYDIGFGVRANAFDALLADFEWGFNSSRERIESFIEAIFDFLTNRDIIVRKSDGMPDIMHSNDVTVASRLAVLINIATSEHSQQ